MGCQVGSRLGILWIHSQTSVNLHIGTLACALDNRKHFQETVASSDFGQALATQPLTFLDFDVRTLDGSYHLGVGLALENTATLTILRHLGLHLDDLELPEEAAADSKLSILLPGHSPAANLLQDHGKNYDTYSLLHSQSNWPPQSRSMLFPSQSLDFRRVHHSPTISTPSKWPSGTSECSTWTSKVLSKMSTPHSSATCSSLGVSTGIRWHEPAHFSWVNHAISFSKALPMWASRCPSAPLRALRSPRYCS